MLFNPTNQLKDKIHHGCNFDKAELEYVGGSDGRYVLVCVKVRLSRAIGLDDSENSSPLPPSSLPLHNVTSPKHTVSRGHASLIPLGQLVLHDAASLQLVPQ